MPTNFYRTVSVCAAFLFSSTCIAQSVSINHNGAAADTSAILDVSSTTKGLLVPRMTAEQKAGIATPATGLLVYQTDGDKGFYYFNGVQWFLLIDAAITNRQQTLLYTIKGF